jgi:hypothetical protein
MTTLYLYPPLQAVLSGGATEAKQDVIIAELVDVNTELDAITTELTALNAVDFATEAKQDDIITELTALNALDFATEAKQDTIIVNQKFAPQSFALLDFAVSNVDDTAYVELISSVGATGIRKIQLFMSSGEPLYLAFGAAAAEVDQLIIIPGGTGVIDFEIPAATRLSVKAINTVTVSSGVIIINLLG